jgi:RNA polymerase subunit RPABC4/transcription elongation factor Spt4
MINNTSCWYCSVVYPKDWPKCPECNHPNANEDLKAAEKRTERHGTRI